VHTDARGNDQWNLELSEKRAQAIYDYLVAKGVAADRLRAKGYGETKPIDKRANEAAWAKNRRTELRILQRKTT
jgi:outer membrane protein OmpA-like peptidoglycan-associated protein